MPARRGACLALLLALAACSGSEGGTAVERTPPAEPPADSPAPPAASPSPASPWELADAFLPPQAAAEAEQPGWSVTEPFEPEAGPVLDPCREERFPRSAAIEASGERALGSEREAGGSGLLQEVFRYSSAQEAAQAFAGYADAVERCPEVADPAAEGQSVRHEAVLQDEVDGVQRLLVRRSPCIGPGMCPPQFASYYLVAQAADGLTAADYGLVEDGDPADSARALLAAVAEQLATAVEG